MKINEKEITPNKVINLLWEHINNGDYEETCTEETFNKLVKSLNRFETAFNISQKQLDRFHEKIMNTEYIRISKR